MPAYINSPFKNLKLLTVDFPEYFIGSYNFDVPYGNFIITSDSISSDVATITGYMTEGNIPAAGDLISIQGTHNSSGAFNVSSVAIASVSINSTTGIGTITFALTATNQGTTNDAGVAKIVPAEGSESYTSGTYKSIAICTESNNPNANNSRTYTVTVDTPTNSSLSATFTLEGSNRDIDSEYTPLSPNGTAITAVAMPSTAGGAASAEYCLTNYRFLRLLLTYTSGSATVVAKIKG